MMAAAIERHARRWSEDEDNLLRSMSVSRKSLTLMAAKLNRPISSIKSRARDLGLHIAGTGIGERRKRK